MKDREMDPSEDQNPEEPLQTGDELWPKRRKRRLIITIVFLIVLMFISPRFEPFIQEAKFKIQQTKYHTAAMTALNGGLESDKYGALILPSHLSSLTAGGRVYIVHGNKGVKMVFFPFDEYGQRGSGYLYCDRPLTKADYDRDGDIKSDLREEGSLTLSRKLARNWYFIEAASS